MNNDDQATVDAVCIALGRIITFLEALSARVEVLELEHLHRQAAGDGMMETQAGCTDAETSAQP